MELYTFFRSSASFRLRIALAYKGIAYEPRFEPSGATVHPLRRRDGKTPHALDRAA